jgi:hypothetical protein
VTENHSSGWVRSGYTVACWAAAGFEIQLAERDNHDAVADRPSQSQRTVGQPLGAALGVGLEPKYRVAHRPKVMASAPSLRCATSARAGGRPERASTRARARSSRACSSAPT